jgi:D-galactarolactone cycloisomerase
MISASHRRHFLQSALTGAAALAANSPLLHQLLRADDEGTRRPDHQTPDTREPLKITAVHTHHVKTEIGIAYGGAWGWSNVCDTLLVEIETDAGLTGWGETAPLQGIQALINELGAKLVGKNALQQRKLWREMWGWNFGNGMALGGIDMALQDVRGKALNLSVAEMYGDRVRDKVPAYASAPNYIQGQDVRKQYPDEGAKLVADGFRALKIRLGGEPLAVDIDAAAALRDAVGPDVKLMVDGNGGYQMGPAIRMGRELDQLGYYFFEEPLPQAGYAGYPELTAALQIPIAAGEVLNSRADALTLIERRGMRIIQPDVSLCGGIGECLFIAEMARLSGIPCIPHCWGGALVTSATLQLVSLLPEPTVSRLLDSPMIELGAYENPFRDELVTNPPKQVDGFVEVPTGPGLGVEVIREVVEKYAVEE